MRINSKVLLLVIVLAILPQVSDAQRTRSPARRDSVSAPAFTPPPVSRKEQALAGVKRIGLYLDVQNCPIDTSEIRNHVELRLRQAGLIVADDEIQHVAMRGVCVGKDLIGLSYSTDFRTLVYVIREKPERYWATVWSSGLGVFTVGASKFSESFTHTMDEEIDRFLNEWLKANNR